MESQWVQYRNMEAWLVHDFSKFLCSYTQNVNLAMILGKCSQNLF